MYLHIFLLLLDYKQPEDMDYNSFPVSGKVFILEENIPLRETDKIK